MIRALLLLGFAHAGCGGVLHAQDAGPASAPSATLVDQFTHTLELAPDTKPKPQVDPRLSAAFMVKVGLCYRSETGKPLSDADRSLLHEYAPELVIQFRAAFASVGCDAQQPPSAACLRGLEHQDCEALAQVVRSHGWDRAPSPEMQAAVDKYTRQLAARYLACQAGPEVDGEVANIRAEHLSHSASIQIAMLLTTGQCSLTMAELDHCLAAVADSGACPSMLELAKHARLPRFCGQFLDCSLEPGMVGKIAQ